MQALFVSTPQKKEDIDLNAPDTWQLRWFDHTDKI